MVRRLLLVLGLVVFGLGAATPTLAQTSESDVRTVLDNLVEAGRPSQEAVSLSMDLLAEVLQGSSHAQDAGRDQSWLKPWNDRVDARIAALEAMLPRLAPMGAAEIQRRSLGFADPTARLRKLNTMRALILESSRQAIFFAKEAKVQAAKAATGDEKALQRMVRIGVASTRLTLQSQMVAIDSSLADMPANHPQKPLGEATQANNRASIEIYLLVERRLSGEPSDAAATASRIRTHTAEARRQALLVDPAVQAQLRLVAAPSGPPAMVAKFRTIMLSYGDSTQTELRIATILDEAAQHIETNVDAPGEDAWGLDRTLPLVEKRVNDHLARVKMVQDF